MLKNVKFYYIYVKKDIENLKFLGGHPPLISRPGVGTRPPAFDTHGGRWSMNGPPPPPQWAAGSINIIVSDLTLDK